MTDDASVTGGKTTGVEPTDEHLELIAAFIDGTLDDANRRELLEVLADDETAYEVFLGAIEYLHVEAERRAAARRKWRVLALVFLLLATSVLLSLVWRCN